MNLEKAKSGKQKATLQDVEGVEDKVLKKKPRTKGIYFFLYLLIYFYFLYQMCVPTISSEPTIFVF